MTQWARSGKEKFCSLLRTLGGLSTSHATSIAYASWYWSDACATESERDGSFAVPQPRAW